MSVSGFYEERRREKRDAAEQAREDRRLEAQIHRDAEQADAERKRQADADKAEQARRDRREAEQKAKREKAERAQRRGERNRSARAWLTAEADTAFSVALILLSVIPAIVSQVGALSGKTDPGSATSLALMLELGAWSATVGASRAMRDGRPVTPYRVAMWGCAAVAAAINLSHNGGAGDWFGWVMFAASLAGVAFWELRCVGRHGNSRRSKEERAAEKARKAHAKERAAAHKDVQRTAERIVSAAGFDTTPFEDAFADAWEVHHGTREIGMTPAMVALRAQSKRRMADALVLDSDAEPLFPDTVPDAFITEFGTTFGTVYRSPIGRDDGDENEGGEGAVPTAPRKPSTGPSEAARPLGGKGKRQFLDGRRERTEKPLDSAHIERVRAYAELLSESGDTISVRKVKELIGGGENGYLSRLTRHVKSERGEQ